MVKIRDIKHVFRLSYTVEPIGLIVRHFDFDCWSDLSRFVSRYIKDNPDASLYISDEFVEVDK